MITKVLSSLYSWIILVVLVIIVITANSFYVVSTLNDLSTLKRGCSLRTVLSMQLTAFTLLYFAWSLVSAAIC